MRALLVTLFSAGMTVSALRVPAPPGGGPARVEAFSGVGRASPALGVAKLHGASGPDITAKLAPFTLPTGVVLARPGPASLVVTCSVRQRVHAVARTTLGARAPPAAALSV